MKTKTLKNKKKPVPKQASYSAAVHDIIDKVKDTHKKADQKLEELAVMCSGKNCKG